MKDNLIIITFDQLRHEYGSIQNKKLKNKSGIRKLTKKALTFSDCYTTCPQCVPARLSWLTGQYPSRWGITKNEDVDVPGETPSFLRKLSRNGWRTEIIGKTHWTSHQHSNDLRNNVERMQSLGIDRITEIAGPRALRRIKCELTDEWERAELLSIYKRDMRERYDNHDASEAWKVRASILPNHLYPDIWIGDKAQQRLKEMPIDKPWVLWISFVGPHEPFDTPIEFKNKRRLFGNINYKNHSQDWIQKLREDDHLAKLQNRWRSVLTNKAIKEVQQDYRDRIDLIDEQLSKILKTLDDRTDAKKTNIIVTSDHGEMLGDGNMLYKGTLLESSIKVPFVYLPSKNKKRKIYSNPITSTDLIHKIANDIIIGNETKESLELWLKSKNYAVVEFREEIAIIKNRKKYVYNLDGELIWSANLKWKENETNSNVKVCKIEKIQKNTPRQTKIDKIAYKEIRKRCNSKWIVQNLITK